MRGVVRSGCDEAIAKRLVDEIIALCHMQVPTPRSYGIDQQLWEQKIPLMAQQALDSGSPTDNPIVPTNVEIHALYADIYG